MDRKGNYNYVVTLHALSPPPPGVPVVCMIGFNLIIAQTRARQREEKDKRYNCGNSNSQDLPNAEGCQHQGSNSQRQPTLSQKPPVSLISPFPRRRNLKPQPLASFPQQGASTLLPSSVSAPPSQPSASIPQKSAPPLLPAPLPWSSDSIPQQ